jgi:hypothetical protein
MCHVKKFCWAIIIYQPYGQPKRENKQESWVHESSARLGERKSYVIKTEIELKWKEWEDSTRLWRFETIIDSILFFYLTRKYNGRH